MDIKAFLFQIKNLRHRARGWREEMMAVAGLGFNCELSATLVKADGSRVKLGVLSRRLVTNAGVAAVVDAFQNLFELELFNFHDSGTGNTAEAVGDTALVTPAGPARVTGTQSEPAANQYRSQATITYTTTQTIVEHGLFSASSGGTLWDRSVFAGIAVNNGDSIQFTYTLTVNAGG